MILDDAIELLNIQSQRQDESREDAIKVVETLGRLPLAIDQAAAYIRFTLCSFQNFVQNFCEGKDILLEEDLPEFWEYKRRQKSGQDNTETDQKLGVWTTWQLSLNLLETGINGSAWVHLLIISAFLNGRKISQACLTLWLKHIGGYPNNEGISVDLSEPERTIITQRIGEAMGNSIDDKFLRFVADAHNLSLIQRQMDGKLGVCYSIHPLVLEWLQRRLHENERRDYIYEGFSVVETCIHHVEDHNDLLIELQHEMIGHCRACLQNNAKLSEGNDKLGTGNLGKQVWKYVISWDIIILALKPNKNPF